MGKGNSEQFTIEAFETALRPILPALYSWAFLRIGSSLRRDIDPQDVVQEVLVRAFGARDKFDPSRGALRSWIFQIAKNYLNEVLRRVRIARRQDFGGHSVGDALSQVPESATALTERVRRSESLKNLLAYVETLQVEDQELFLRLGLQGESMEQAARRLGLETAAAHKRWQRLRIRLRERPSVLELLA